MTNIIIYAYLLVDITNPIGVNYYLSWIMRIPLVNKLEVSFVIWISIRHCMLYTISTYIQDLVSKINSRMILLIQKVLGDYYLLKRVIYITHR